MPKSYSYFQLSNKIYCMFCSAVTEKWMYNHLNNQKDKEKNWTWFSRWDIRREVYLIFRVSEHGRFIA
jgi:hypothetical protein